MRESLGMNRGRVREHVNLDELRPEQYLYARVLRRAYLDIRAGITTLRPREKRWALGSLWWIWGHPFPLPFDIPDAVPRLLNRQENRIRKEIDPDRDALDLIGWCESDLWAPSVEPYLPPELWPELHEDLDWMRYAHLCDLMGIDPDRLRIRTLSLVGNIYDD